MSVVVSASSWTLRDNAAGILMQSSHRKYASGYATKTLGLRVVQRRLLEAVFEPAFFDVITMWNVLERLEQPRQELSHLSKMLKAGGLFVFSFGNVDSYLAKFQGKRWRVFSPPDAMNYFSPKTISLLLASCNLQPVAQIPALPREKLLARLRLITVLRSLKLSDKVYVYARKTVPSANQHSHH